MENINTIDINLSKGGYDISKYILMIFKKVCEVNSIEYDELLDKDFEYMTVQEINELNEKINIDNIILVTKNVPCDNKATSDNSYNLTNVEITNREELIDKLNKQQSPSASFDCELILFNTWTKIYFDIDVLNNMNFSFKDIMILINRFVLGTFTFTDPIYSVACSEGNNKKQASYHIMIINYIVNRYDRRKLRALLCDHTHCDQSYKRKIKKIESSIDPCVYGYLQCMRLLYNGKNDNRYLLPMGTFKIDNKENIYFDDQIFDSANYIATSIFDKDKRAIFKHDFDVEESNIGTCIELSRLSSKYAVSNNVKHISYYLDNLSKKKEENDYKNDNILYEKED